MTNATSAVMNAPSGTPPGWMLLKSGLPPILPTSDMIMSTKALTTRPKAAAITNATASSTKLPCITNFLNPLMSCSSFPDGFLYAVKLAENHLSELPACTSPRYEPVRSPSGAGRSHDEVERDPRRSGWVGGRQPHGLAALNGHHHSARWPGPRRG